MHVCTQHRELEENNQGNNRLDTEETRQQPTNSPLTTDQRPTLDRRPKETRFSYRTVQETNHFDIRSIYVPMKAFLSLAERPSGATSHKE